MKKKSVSIMVFILLILTMFSLMGCSNDDVDNKGGTVSAKQEEKKDEKGSRSNPIKIGENSQWKVKFYSDIDDWDGLEGLVNLVVNKVYEGQEAIDMLYFGEESLDDVEEGYTFAVADFTVELLEGDEDSPYTTSFQLGSVSEDGRKSPYSYTSLTDKYEDNEYTDLYPGGSVNISQAFLVPKDGEYLLEIEENISGSKFFKHK